MGMDLFSINANDYRLHYKTTGTGVAQVMVRRFESCSLDPRSGTGNQLPQSGFLGPVMGRNHSYQQLSR